MTKLITVMSLLVLLSGCGLFSPGFIPYVKTTSLDWQGEVKKDRLNRRNVYVLTNIKPPEKLSQSKKEVVEFQGDIILMYKKGGKKKLFPAKRFVNQKVIIHGSLDFWESDLFNEHSTLLQFLIVNSIKKIAPSAETKKDSTPVKAINR